MFQRICCIFYLKGQHGIRGTINVRDREGQTKSRIFRSLKAAFMLAERSIRSYWLCTSESYIFIVQSMRVASVWQVTLALMALVQLKN